MSAAVLSPVEAASGASRLAALRSNVTDVRDRCREAAEFPSAAVAVLRRCGLLTAPLPDVMGGCGWGTEMTGADTSCEALCVIGGASLSLGRIYEAHINAVALVHRYGSRHQLAQVAEDLFAGRLFALWVTAGPAQVRLQRESAGYRVTGTMRFCTAAGYADRAVILADGDEVGDSLVLIDATHVQRDGEPIALHGMRLTATGPVRLDCHLGDDALFGAAGSYLREPMFSASAWRTSAVTAGGLQALVEETSHQLVARGRHRNEHQLARLGEMQIAVQTALMWVQAAARRAETSEEAPEAIVAFVNLARLAVEKACLAVIPLVQRCLGLACMLPGNPVEAMMRDLATYLRQPAGDEALVEAAAWFAGAAA